MPKYGKKLSPTSTHAVGAVLFQQFMRERLIQNGIDMGDSLPLSLDEDLNFLTASLMQDDEDAKARGDYSSSSSENNEDDDSEKPCSDDTLEFTTNGTYGSSIPETIDSLMRDNSTVSTSLSTDHPSIYHSLTDGNNASARTDTSSSTLNSPGNIKACQPSNERPNIQAETNLETQKETVKELNKRLKQLEKDPLLALYGRDLRRIAEEFERDRLRKVVKKKAEEVSFEHITKDSFFKLLEELFLYGFTREKIVILFFFCTDVALKAYNNAPALVAKLLTWSLAYIVTRICAWVQKLGGWDVVLCSYFPKAIHICLGVLGIFALGIFIRRNVISLMT